MVLRWILSGSSAGIIGSGFGSCGGDSPGPARVQYTGWSVMWRGFVGVWTFVVLRRRLSGRRARSVQDAFWGVPIRLCKQHSARITPGLCQKPLTKCHTNTTHPLTHRTSPKLAQIDAFCSVFAILFLFSKPGGAGPWRGGWARTHREINTGRPYQCLQTRKQYSYKSSL